MLVLYSSTYLSIPLFFTISHADKNQPTQVDNTLYILMGAVAGGLILAAVVIAVVVVTYGCYKKNIAEDAQAAKSKVSLENFQMHINFINRAFLHLCIDSDEEKELDFEMQQCFLDFLRNILLRGKRDKTIGPEIAQVVRVVFGKGLSDGRLVEETRI